jgi:hypothetical protein
VIEPRGPEVGAQAFAETLLVAEHYPEENSAALATTRLTWPISRAVASATSKFSCWSARLKTVRGSPCEVDVPPPLGPRRRFESRAMRKRSWEGDARAVV